MSPTPEDREALADEYVLGLLDPEEAEAFEAHLERDRDLRRSVGEARERLLAFDAGEEEVAVPPTLWSRIETVIGNPPGPFARRRLRRLDPPPPASHRRLRRWRRAAAAGIAASLVLAAALAWQIATVPKPVVIAVLLDERGDPVALVEDYGDDRARVIPLTDIEVPDDRALEVWTLPDQDDGPVSLGLLQRGRATTLHGPDLPPPTADQLYEITLEDEAGSATGGPTGPIIGKGFARVPR